MDDTTRKQNAESVVIEGTKSGLGIRIVGGRNVTSESEDDFGIFVKEVITGSLAASDGRLERGDQLLEANGTSLMGVSNENAVDILKKCAASDQIALLVARDDKSKSDFRRLSSSLQQQQQQFWRAPLLAYLPQGVPQTEPLPQPVAHSTPRVAAEGTDADTNSSPGGMKESRMYDGAAVLAADQRSSASSELMHISTTDISSHADESDHTPFSSPIRHAPPSPTSTPPRPPLPGIGAMESPSNASSQKSVALSDVVVAVGSSTLIDSTAVPPPAQSAAAGVHQGANGSNDDEEETKTGPPPPVPTSPPPDVDSGDDQLTLTQPKKHEPSAIETAVPVAPVSSRMADAAFRRASPEGRSVSSPPVSPSFLTITFTKTKGLGAIISGGVNRPNGPHIFIEKVLEGMDAAKDGRLQKGDRILAVNGENFANLTREKALTILTQLKIRPQVRSYTISFERPSAANSPGDTVFTSSGPPLSLPSPPRTTTASIFDSDTLPARGTAAKPTDAPGAYSSVGQESKPSPTLEQGLTAQDLVWLKESGTSAGDGTAKMAHTPLRYLTKKDTSGYDKAKYDSLHKRLSLDPKTKVKLSKMEWALSYMGYIVTREQKQKMHSTLDIDEEGKVVFAEFVQLARELFQFRLDDTHLEANLVMALTQKEGLEMPAMPTKATSLEQLLKEVNPQPSSLSSSHPSSLSGEPSGAGGLPMKSEADLESMRQQLHDLGHLQDQKRRTGAESELEKLRVENELNIQENARLQMLLNQKEREIEQVVMGKSPRADRPETEDAKILRKRLALAEAATKAARTKEHQLEESVQCMEAELSALRVDGEHVSTAEMKKRLAILTCQMNKEQGTSRLYQVATERLLRFAEACHEALVKSPEADRIMFHPHGKGESVRRGDAITGNPRPPPYLSKHAKVTATTLAQEAQETVMAVRKMLQNEALPFGWEEAFTDEGEKYYIDHDNQRTSWVHPMTKESPGSAHTSRSSTPASHSRRSSRSSRGSGAPEPPPQPVHRAT